MKARKAWVPRWGREKNWNECVRKRVEKRVCWVSIYGWLSFNEVLTQ